MKRLAAIVTGPSTYLDHLGILSYVMDMPLFITEKETYLQCLNFYPQVRAIQKNADEIDAVFLAEQFDVLFESGKFFKMQTSPLIELLYQRKLRYVYSPHGHSDKGHSATQFAHQDISLIYGDHMKDLLEQTGALKSISSTAPTGNYRLSFYQKYQLFYDKLTFDLTHPKIDPSKQTILYAPSWQDGENPSSFFSSTGKIIEDLKNQFNLVIKLHPFLEKFHPAETHFVLEKYKNDPHVLFLDSFPCIYPLLQICDIYIGDYSSIGYDFLSFNRPLYFLLPDQGPLFEIHKAGLIIPKDENLSAFIEKTLSKNRHEKEDLRKSLYKYVFGEEKPFDVLQKEILEIL